ncbi:MAG: adenylate/guanylate cyclase domain-containing protein [Verrucomicrobiota bacterium]
MEAELWQEPKGLRAKLTANTVIGRSPEADIKVFSSRVSREHCMVRQQASGFWLYDLGSANGTLLNDREVSQPTQLKHGDVISMADIVFRFHVPGETGDGSGAAADESSSMTIMAVRKKPIIILVADIMDYSGLSEKLTEEELAKVLNAWYEDCRRVMDARGGVIDKFIGDAMFGYWNATTPELRQHAIDAAKEIIHPQNWTEEAQQLLTAHGLSVECGAGLHIGEAAVGSVARGTRTALGDAVNIAFRIESMTRPLERKILASDGFFAGWDAGRSQAASCGTHELKGYTGDYELFSLG